MGAPISDSRWTPASVRRALDEEAARWSEKFASASWREECAKLEARRTSAELADSLPQEMPARVNEMLRQKDERDSDVDSDDGRILQVHHEDLSEIVECKQIEFNEPESFQF